MHALIRIVTVLSVVFAATTLFAAIQDQQSAPANQSPQAHQPATSAQPMNQACQSAATATPAQASAAQQRVVRHDGHWWYQMPDQRWVVWQNNAWTPYSAGMFAGERNRTANQSVRRYSYDPQLQNYSGSAYPRMFNAPSPSGSSRSIRYAGSKANFDYAPYTGGGVR